MRPETPIKLTDIEVTENAFIADGNADSTRDGGKRPPTWNPPVVSKEEYENENPYVK